MTTSGITTAPRAARRAARPARGALLIDRTTMAVGFVVALQALVLATVMSRGWYTDADLPNIGAATGVPLSWHYLSSSVGGHFGAPGRLIYWVLNRVAPLNWPVTIALRLVLQSAATVALWRLLVVLIGRRPWLPVLLLLYALNPILVPGLAWLTSGIGLALGQLTLCLMMLAHVRYARGGSIGWAVLAALLAIASLLFADQTLACLVLLPIVSWGFVYQGSFRERLAAMWSQREGWLVLVLLMMGYAGYYLSGTYNTGSSRFTLGAAWSITRSQWLDVLGPSVVGGPWQWASNPNGFVSYATPPTSAVLTGQLVLLALAVLSIRARGRQAVVAWSMPVLVGVSSVVLVGKGRFDVLGTFVTPLLRYSFYLPLALTIGAALAFAPALDEVRAPVEPAIASEPGTSDGAEAAGAAGVDDDGDLPPAAEPDPVVKPHPGARLDRSAAAAGIPVLAVAVAVIAVLCASLVSAATFTHRFWQNPAQDYVRNVTASARAGGPQLTVYDAALPPTVVAYVEPNHFVSDILGLAGLPVRYQGDAAQPVVADADGRLVPATFFRSADSAGPLKAACGTYIHGAGTWRIPLSSVLAEKDWFLRLEVYQPHANSVTVSVIDAKGKTVGLVGGPGIELRGSVSAETRRIATAAPAAVVVHSTSSATNFCLVHTYVGVPLPKAQK